MYERKYKRKKEIYTNKYNFVANHLNPDGIHIFND